MTGGPAADAARPPRGARKPPLTHVTRRLERLPLRFRLMAVLLVLLLAALVLTSAATSAMLRGSLMDRTDQDLRLAAVPVANAAISSLYNNRHPDVDTFVPPNTYAVRIMPTDGSPPRDATTSTTETSRPDIPLLGLDDPRVRSHAPFNVGSVNGDDQWRVIAGTTSGRSATYAVAVSLNGVEATVQRLRLLTILIGLLVITACAVIGWFAVRRAFRPLTEIEDTAAAIAAGDLTRRIPERTADDEVTSLSRSLNVMLAQIEQSFAVREASEERMRQFVADASHELRTPLATVRGYAELFRQGAVREPEDVAGAMRRIEDEATRMGGLVEDLLMLARLDGERPVRFAPVDLTVLAVDAAQDARALDPGRPIRVSGLAGDLVPTVVEGDESRLRQVVTNLVANAINHTPPGTAMELAVGRRSGDTSVIEVRDHGPGIDPVKARKVFERFYRADPSRARGGGGGNGLGLAIVAAIVTAHRGKVGVAPTPGGGATLVVELPVSPAGAAASPAPATTSTSA